MKKHLWITFALFCFTFPIFSQSVHSDYVDGVITFKINDSSEVVLPDYELSDTGTYPFLDSLITQFGITSIYRPMQYSSKLPLRRIYRVYFDSIAAADTLKVYLLQYSFIELAEKQPFYKLFSAPAPNDTKLIWQWALKRIMADSLWHLLDSGGKEIKIAVIDDAVLTTHEDLQDVILPGWDIADNDANTNPPASATEIYFAHGTCVASIAGAKTNNGKGISSMNLNNKIKIIPIKISTNASVGTMSPLYQAIDTADALGADIISISLGGDVYDPFDFLAIQQTSSRIFVIASGNSGDSSYNYPASYNLPNIISVGGSNQYDEKTAFSNYNKHVDVIAPATGILGASAAGNHHYGYKMGTSYSTPLVSGLCALLWSREGTLTLAQVIDRVVNASDDVSHINPQYSNQLGAGRINALRTLYPTTPDFFAGFRANSGRQLCNGDTLSFTAKTYTGIAYNWDFGDGNTTTIYSPTVGGTYSSAGLFHPSLTLTDSITGDTVAYERYEGFVSVGTCNAPNGNNTNWIFGRYGSMTFDNGFAEAKNDIFNAGTLWSIGTSVTENDPVTGNLLYYAGFNNTNDQSSINSYIKVWNPDHSLSVELGGKTGQSFQSMLSIPLNNKYLLFANSLTSTDLHYYIITPGTGGVSVNSSPQPVKVGAFTGFADTSSDGTIRIGAGFTAIPGCTANEYWLVGQASDFASVGHRTQMLIIKVQNNSGVITALLHQVYDMPSGFELRNKFYLIKTSSDGNWIARSNYGQEGDESATTDLFTFDKNTGTINHKYRLAHGGRGISFSPDSKKLYVGDLGAVFYQYNLEDYDPEQSTMPIPIEFNHTIMQSGPDGKLYITGTYTDTISIIAHPNHLNSLDSQNNCGFNSRGVQMVEGTKTIVGFPNFIDAKTADKIDLNFTVRQTGCRQYSFYPNKFCPASWSWKFGDGSTSTSKEPTHTYAQGGVYTVKLFHDGDSVEKTVYVGAGFYGDTVICDTAEIYTNYYPFNELFDYKWSVTNGDLIGADSNYNIQVKFHGTGTVKLVLNDPHIPCLDSVTATIHYGINTDSVFSDTVFTNIAPAFTGCGYEISGAISYDLNPHYTWLMSEDRINWDTAGQDSSGFTDLFTGDPNTLWLTRLVTTACFTSFSDTILVTSQMNIYQQPQDFVSCDGQTFVNIGISNPLDLPYTIGWEADSSGNWVELTTYTDTFVESSIPLGSGYRALLAYGACTVYSDTADYLSATDSAINTISLSSGACFPGAEFLIDGDSGVINDQDTSVRYQWQVWDGTGWQNTSAQDTLMNFSGIIDYDSVYYRRKIFSMWCENYSDSILVHPKIRITRHPDHVSRCISDDEAVRTFHLGTQFINSWQNYKAYFVVKKFIDIIGYVYVVEDSMDYLTYPTFLDSLEYGLTDLTYEYFFKISTPCGFYYSDTALLYPCYAGNWTVLMPDTVYTTEDSLVTLITHNAHCSGGPLLEDSYTYWQYSNNGTDWITINDTCGDTLRFTASYCENGFYYRTVFHDPCANQDRYSPAARLFVTRTNFARLMMRDYYDDDGSEPNETTDWRNLYDPPSFLIRLNNTWGPEHKTPNWGTDTAYVFYTIHNIDDTDTSKPAKLKMYWTFGGPHGADWDIAWKDAVGNRFYNNDSGSGSSYQQWHPYGDFINEIPIEVPSIAPGDSIRDYFMWTDFPNPMRYYVWKNDSIHYDNQRPMCMLARIETCPQDSFGMSYKEVTATRQNIINNRKIVGRNTSVTNVNGTYGKKDVTLTVRRFAGDDDPVWLEFEEVGNCGFGSFGTVKAVLSDALWEAWRDGGDVGSGFSVGTYGVLTVTNLSSFVLGNIELDPDSVSTITFEFELTLPPLNPLNCRFAFAQYQGESSTPYGTFVMNVNASGDPERLERVKEPLAQEQDSLGGFKGEAFEKEANLPEEETGSGESTLIEKSLFAYPNPFTNEVNFYFELAAGQNVGFEIYSSLGEEVGRIDTRAYPMGTHQVIFDGSRLAPGMYLCRVKVGQETKTLRLVIVR